MDHIIPIGSSLHSHRSRSFGGYDSFRSLCGLHTCLKWVFVKADDGSYMVTLFQLCHFLFRIYYETCD